MNIPDQKLLLEYARLQLQIAASRMPAAEVDVTPENIVRSVGYKKLRDFFVRMSPRKRDVYRKMLRREIVAVAAVVAKAKETGEELSLADVTFIVRDEESGVMQDIPTAQEVRDADREET